MFIFAKNHHGKKSNKKESMQKKSIFHTQIFSKIAYYKKAVSLEQSVTNDAAYIFIGI